MSTTGYAALYQPTIDALPAHLCVLDETGRITSVNRAWREFARTNGWADPAAGVGVRYTDVCDTAARAGSLSAARFAEGIRGALTGSLTEFVQEYDCHSPAEERWFLGRVTRLPHQGLNHVLVTHEPITARVRAERSARDIVRSLESQVFARTADLVAANADLAAEVDARRAADAERERLIDELTAALERVKTLRGVVPICAWCKKIRDDQGYWEQVEVFVQNHTDAEFSHGLCPQCERKLYRDLPGNV